MATSKALGWHDDDISAIHCSIEDSGNDKILKVSLSKENGEEIDNSVILPAGGGDITATGNNDFTGSNSFNEVYFNKEALFMSTPSFT